MYIYTYTKSLNNSFIEEIKAYTLALSMRDRCVKLPLIPVKIISCIRDASTCNVNLICSLSSLSGTSTRPLNRRSSKDGF